MKRMVRSVQVCQGLLVHIPKRLPCDLVRFRNSCLSASQQWDVQVTVYNDSRSTIGDPSRTYNFTNSDPSIGITNTEDLRCLVQYTLYDGPDALIATKLVEMGVAVRPENVDWYKRQLLEGTV